MNELIEKLTKERMDLIDKILKITDYINSKPDVTDMQLSLLNSQQAAMTAYNNILGARIMELMGN